MPNPATFLNKESEKSCQPLSALCLCWARSGIRVKLELMAAKCQTPWPSLVIIKSSHQRGGGRILEASTSTQQMANQNGETGGGAQTAHHTHTHTHAMLVTQALSSDHPPAAPPPGARKGPAVSAPPPRSEIARNTWMPCVALGLTEVFLLLSLFEMGGGGGGHTHTHTHGGIMIPPAPGQQQDSSFLSSPEPLPFPPAANCV